ncbi:hypothetical protein ACW6MV_001781 [Escherichia coli]
MPSLEELAEQHSSQLSSVLKSAVETISSDQEITFRLYVRQVLPLDGFVYWVNAEIISCDELCRLNIESPTRLKIKGSLHRQVIAIQDESVSKDVNNIIFTPVQQVDDFNVENPDAIYLGEYGGVQFAFSRMESRYQQSGIFHYRGMAILPTMRSQIIDCEEDISDEQIISNSIPIWLQMKDAATVYPSYLVPQNLRPPYIAVDVRNSIPLPATNAAAAVMWNYVSASPSEINKVPPMAFRYLQAVNAHKGKNSILATMTKQNINYIETGAEGGISNTILVKGVTSDGNDMTYWYSVDWVQINVDMQLANAVINGCNNPINPLYYNQDGIDRLQQVAQAVFNTGVSYGLVNGQPVVDAVPFRQYINTNPNDYGIGRYAGLSASYTPMRGFVEIIFNINVTMQLS